MKNVLACLALIAPLQLSASPQSEAADTIHQLSDTFEAARTAEMSVWVPTPSVILLEGCNMTVVGRSPSQGYIREIYQADLRNTTVVRAKLDTPPLNTDLPPMNLGLIGFLTPPRANTVSRQESLDGCHPVPGPDSPAHSLS